MTQDDYKRIIDGFDKAEESVTPFAIPTEEEIVVVGDANETEINRHDFKVTFKYPKEQNGKVIYQEAEVEYKNVYITPRQEHRILRLMTGLMPYFRKVGKDGTSEKYTSDEVKQIIEELDDTINDQLYGLVATVLHIDSELVDYMTLDSVMYNVGQIFYMYPEMVNEASTFFPQSSKEPTITAVK